MTYYTKIGNDGERTGHARTISSIINKELEPRNHSLEHEIDTLRDQVSTLSNLLEKVIDVMPEEHQHAFAKSLGYHLVPEHTSAKKNKR